MPLAALDAGTGMPPASGLGCGIAPTSFREMRAHRRSSAGMRIRRVGFHVIFIVILILIGL